EHQLVAFAHRAASAQACDGHRLHAVEVEDDPDLRLARAAHTGDLGQVDAERVERGSVEHHVRADHYWRVGLETGEPAETGDVSLLPLAEADHDRVTIDAGTAARQDVDVARGRHEATTLRRGHAVLGSIAAADGILRERQANGEEDDERPDHE